LSPNIHAGLTEDVDLLRVIDPADMDLASPLGGSMPAGKGGLQPLSVR
jgi:hypothetical protein